MPSPVSRRRSAALLMLLVLPISVAAQKPTKPTPGPGPTRWESGPLAEDDFFPARGLAAEPASC